MINGKMKTIFIAGIMMLLINFLHAEQLEKISNLVLRIIKMTESYDKLMERVINGEDYLAFELEEKALLKDDITGLIISKLSTFGNDIYLEELEELFNSGKSPDWNKIDRFLDTIPPSKLKAPASWWIEVNDGSTIPEKWWLVRELETFDVRSEYCPCMHPEAFKKLRVLRMEDDIAGAPDLRFAKNLKELVIMPAPNDIKRESASFRHAKLAQPEDYLVYTPELRLWSGELPYSKDLSAFKNVPLIEELYAVIGNENEKSFDISGLSFLKKLKTLYIQCTNTKVYGWEALSKPEKLESLNLGGFFGENIDLRPAENLKELSLREFTGSTFLLPNGIKKLYLSLNDNLNLNFIKGLKSLEKLSLSHIKNIQNFSVIKELPDLKSITIKNCPGIDEKDIPDNIKIKGTSKN